MTFNEYLNIGADNSPEIFEFYLSFLSELSAKDFPYEEQLKLKGAAGKFLNCVEKVAYTKQEERDGYNTLIENFSEDLRYYRRSKNISKFSSIILPIKKRSLHRIQDTFEDIYAKTLFYINEVSRQNSYIDSIELNGFYKPENSNKKKIRELINDAIDLVQEDNTLSEKTKKHIIDYLHKALKDLDREHVNWLRFVGRIKETIIILGALGSFSSGVTGYISPLEQAKDKLEETTIVIQQTSINLNYNILNETFNIQNIKQIGPINSTILELNENNSAAEKPEENEENN